MSRGNVTMRQLEEITSSQVERNCTLQNISWPSSTGLGDIESNNVTYTHVIPLPIIPLNPHSIPFTLRLSIQQFQAPHASAPMLCWFTSLGSYFYCFLCLDCSFFPFPFLPYLLCLDNPTYPLRPSSGSPFPGSLPWPSPYPQHVGLYTSLCILIQICVFITLNFNHLFTQLTVSLYRIEGPQEQACGWD